MVRRLSLGLGVMPAAARPVPTSAPVNTVLPSITGALTQGQTLTADPGSWTGLPSGAFDYQWQRSGSDIAGATNSTYVAQAADVSAGASAITVEVTATNDLGSTTAESAGVTIAAPLTLSGTPGAATVGAAYSFTPTTAGGHSAYSYALTGTLPAGLSFSTSTGAITGTPTSSGTASGLDITVTDDDGLTASLGTFSITVSVGATADIESFEIMGATPLLDATNDYGDSTSRVGVNANGWVAKATMPYLVGETFDPSKITIELSDPGYSAAGVTTTRTRTIRGGRVLRRQRTAGGAEANNQISNDGTTFTVYFSLIGDDAEFATVYEGTSIISAEAASGYYGSSSTGVIASPTNSSTRPYYKPGIAWLNRQHERATSGHYVELVTMHKHAMNGQQVAGVEFIAKDSQGTPNVAATQTCNTPTISTLCTKGQPPEVYSATIPLTNLTQADLCFVNAKIYPWLGDSSAVLDVEVDGIAVTGTYACLNPQTTLRFLCDKTEGYGGAHAAVKAGVTGGTVQSSRAAAEATPFPTLYAALNALPAWNNTNKGHNNHSGGAIWLMDDGAGGAVEHEPGNNMGSIAVGKCLTEIRASPSNTALASVRVDVSARTVPSMLSWHVDIRQGAGGQILNGGTGGGLTTISYYNDGTWTQTNVNNLLTHQQNAGLRNLTHEGVGALTVASMWMGYVNRHNAGNIQCRIRAVIGCDLLRVYLADFDPTGYTDAESQDGKIIVNNRFRNIQSTGALGQNNNTSVGSYTRGIFVGQNVFEQSVVALVPAVSIGEQTSVTPLDNVVITGNTVPGNRANFLYTAAAGTAGVLKRGWSRFNLLDERNTKSDNFTTDSTATGRHGNWEFLNGVDNWDMVIEGSSGGGDTPALTGAWIGEYWGSNTEYAVGRANVGFVDDNSQAGSNTGDGDYALTGASNAAYDFVPTGRAPFRYDLAGELRLNDGTGAAGAYERP